MTETIGELIERMGKALRTGFILLAKFLTIALLGFLIALLFIIPWLIRAGGLLIFAYGLFEIITAVNMIYASFTDTVPLVALYTFVGSVQLALFFVVSALDLRLIDLPKRRTLPLDCTARNCLHSPKLAVRRSILSCRTAAALHCPGRHRNAQSRPQGRRLPKRAACGNLFRRSTRSTGPRGNRGNRRR